MADLLIRDIDPELKREIERMPVSTACRMKQSRWSEEGSLSGTNRSNWELHCAVSSPQRIAETILCLNFRSRCSARRIF